MFPTFVLLFSSEQLSFVFTILSWDSLIRKILTELYAVLKIQDLVMEIPTEEFRHMWAGKSTISNHIEYFFYP
jgi:hypothetical protein